jgi:hypothetical protein
MSPHPEAPDAAFAVTNDLGPNYERGDLLCNGYVLYAKSCARVNGAIYAHRDNGRINACLSGAGKVFVGSCEMESLEILVPKGRRILRDTDVKTSQPFSK